MVDLVVKISIKQVISLDNSTLCTILTIRVLVYLHIKINKKRNKIVEKILQVVKKRALIRKKIRKEIFLHLQRMIVMIHLMKMMIAHQRKKLRKKSLKSQRNLKKERM